MRQLHRCNSKFPSVTAIRVSLIEQFDEQMPDSVKFNVGYIDSAYDNVRSPDIFRSNIMHVRGKPCVTGHLDWS